MRSIGLVGRARTGKDTSAAFLSTMRGYTRLAFADPLREAALALDPIVTEGWVQGRGGRYVGPGLRLSSVVGELGWEDAKDAVPEVRRILQRLGDEAGRQIHGENLWIKHLLTRAGSTPGPVVVSDVRYANEAAALRRAGFLLVRIERPGVGPQEGEHASERVEDVPVDRVLYNSQGVRELLGLVDYLPDLA